MSQIHDIACRLRSKIRRRLPLPAIVLGLGIMAIFPSTVFSAAIWSYDDYWGINGWRTTNVLAATTLSLEKTGDTIRLSWPFINPAAESAVQTTTELPPTSAWETITNQPTTSYIDGIRSLSLSADDPQRFFRLVALQTNWFPVFSFAIFYDTQLEFTQCAPMTINGRTHANGPVCLGAASGNILRFNGTVTTTSSLVVSNLGGYSSFAVPVYNGTPTFRTSTPQLKLSGIVTNHTIISSNRVIIEFPPTGESLLSADGQQRFYNKAGVVLLISNNNITVNIKELGSPSGFISNYTYSSFSNIFYATNVVIGAQRTNLNGSLPFLSLTNRFYDYRESKWVMVSQINMSILKNWLTTNQTVLTKFPLGAGSYPTIMYVADFRTLTNLHAVRVVNGALIPTNGINHASARGFTLATINPLYVWGNYNLPNSSAADKADPSATFPASFICDAITILSGAWTDSVYGNGSTTLSSRSAANTTVNAAIIAGSVYTTGTGAGNWSGGVHNLPRLLENWSGDTLTLNSSLVNLYPSMRATNQFQNPGVYYLAPTRNFNWNTNFIDPAGLPPGTPSVVTVSTLP